MSKKDVSIIIGDLKKQITALETNIKGIVARRVRKLPAEKEIKNHMQIVNSVLNQIFILFLINRIETEERGSKNEEALVQARKLSAAVLSYWEEQVGREFDDLYESKRPIHQHMKNTDVFAHFKKIGFIIDYFDLFYAEDTRWQASLLTIRTRFLITFCNALNFKVLLKELDPEYDTYVENTEIIELLKTMFNETVQAFWNQNVKAEEFNILEMNKALALIQFFKNFTSVIEDRETHENFKKKYSVWKKYIEEKSEEQKKTAEKQASKKEADVKKPFRGRIPSS